jgi:RNA polymerase sigma factor (sigma-70 family)
VTALPPFSSVLDEHRDVVWRYLVASVGRADAADCFQETFLAALRAYPALRPGSNLKGWLLTVAHSKVVDAWRATQRRPVPVGAVPDRPDAAPAITEDDDGLWAAVRHLPPKQRTAVTARFVADLPYAQVAAIVGCSEAAARQNVAAALKTLRGELS